MKAWILLGLLLTSGGPGLAAQTAAAPTTPATTTTPSPVVHAADPYTEKEFPSWVLQLRRAEIITVGAFPLAYLFAGLGFDLYYYASNGFPQENIPWPAGPGTSQWTTTSQPDLLQKKNVALVQISLCVSLAVAVADWFLGLDE